MESFDPKAALDVALSTMLNAPPYVMLPGVDVPPAKQPSLNETFVIRARNMKLYPKLCYWQQYRAMDYARSTQASSWPDALDVFEDDENEAIAWGLADEFSVREYLYEKNEDYRAVADRAWEGLEQHDAEWNRAHLRAFWHRAAWTALWARRLAGDRWQKPTF